MIANKVGRLWYLAILVKFKVVIAFFLVRTNILVKVVVRSDAFHVSVFCLLFAPFTKSDYRTIELISLAKFCNSSISTSSLADDNDYTRFCAFLIEKSST